MRIFFGFTLQTNARFRPKLRKALERAELKGEIRGYWECYDELRRNNKVLAEAQQVVLAVEAKERGIK